MQFENEFVVDAPVDQTWATLLDIRRVAQCLPGAVLESDGADGVFRGSMKVKLGPATLGYQGTARMADVEEDAHSATIEVKAKEQKGQGSASARIQNQLSPGPHGSTKVTVLTDLNITGRPAQFGRGIMEDVAGKMLQEFAKRLETEVVGTNGSTAVPASAPAAPSAAGADARPSPEPAEAAGLDLGAVLLGPLAKRAGVGLGAVALLALLRMAVRSRKTGLSVKVSWR